MGELEALVQACASVCKMRGLTLRLSSTPSILLTITLFALSPWGVAARKAKGDTGGSQSEGQASCTTVYLGGYHGGLGYDNFVAYDFESSNDANESDPVMFDALLADDCKPLPQEDWVPFINKGPNSNGRLINLVGQDSGFDDYYWKKFDCPPTLDEEAGEDAVALIACDHAPSVCGGDDRRSIGRRGMRRGMRRGLRRGIARPRNVTRSIGEAIAQALRNPFGNPLRNMRRGGQCEWADWDKGGERTVFSLPALEDSCDPNTLEVGWSRCETREAAWACNVTNSASMQAKFASI